MSRRELGCQAGSYGVRQLTGALGRLRPTSRTPTTWAQWQQPDASPPSSATPPIAEAQQATYAHYGAGSNNGHKKPDIIIAAQSSQRARSRESAQEAGKPGWSTSPKEAKSPHKTPAPRASVADVVGREAVRQQMVRLLRLGRTNQQILYVLSVCPVLPLSPRACK